MNAREAELIALRACLRFMKGGEREVLDRIAELEAAAPKASLWDTMGHGGRWKDAPTLGDAVVKAVRNAGKFVTARAVVEELWDFPPMMEEPDARYRRRKVSQALYVQSTKNELVSRKPDKTTYWGLPGWLFDNAPDVEHAPDPRDQDDTSGN